MTSDTPVTSDEKKPAESSSNNKLLMTDTMAEAGRKIFAGQFEKMQQHEDGSRTGEDIESVHQMRVATRRMRSLFRLIGNYYKSKSVAKYNRKLRDIARSLGRIRDLDVLVADLQDFQKAQNKETQAIVDQIIAKIDKRRNKNRAKLNDLFDSKSYRKFLQRFEKFTHKHGKDALPVEENETPHQVRHLLPVLLHERLSLVRAYDTVLGDTDDATYHALRVEFKQLRYAVEFFKPVLGSTADDFITVAKTMQDLLGRMSDIAVFVDYVRSLKKLDETQEAVVEQYCVARAQELDRLQGQFDAKWQSFNTRTTQRYFSDALLVLR